MRRFTQIVAAAVSSAVVALTGASVAQAQPLQIDCHAHILDATVEQGIKQDVLEYSVKRLRTIVPSADVYLQAYEQLPGGSLDAFRYLALQQCSNWVHPEFSDRFKDNLFVVVYGRDIDDADFFYGFGFEPAIYQHHDSVLAVVRANFGPQYSLARPDFIGQALVEPVRTARLQAQKTHYYSAADEIYYMPAYALPKGHVPTDWFQVGMVVSAVVGVTLLIIVIGNGLAAFIRVVRK